MNIAGKQQSKMHGPPPMRHADMTQHGAASQMGGSHNVAGAVPGELHDTPGSHSAQFVTTDYGLGKHEAYDAEFAQPAYSGHGKVRTGSTSAL